ncbi:MAG: hypothetical protein M1826_002073 [Phylliscum demangeonii]|nr:MAG: hypothetical protein M1826_002073 [Phylliscum demangeonii]
MASSNSASAAAHAQSSSAQPSAIRRDLTSWWRRFNMKMRKDEDARGPGSAIFGVPLHESIRYANVAISLTDGDGKSFIYGYVPIVVAKCGVYLKEKATDIEGIFRLSGSSKRIKELQGIFNAPDRYGKGLDWTGFTVHDAANILRRYLNLLPEPIIPLEYYETFRDPMRDLGQQVKAAEAAQAKAQAQAHAQGPAHPPLPEPVPNEAATEAHPHPHPHPPPHLNPHPHPHSHPHPLMHPLAQLQPRSYANAPSLGISVDEMIAIYQHAITELPPLNRQLLLYLLDLLAVFASKADLNRMNAANLSSIFQPGMLTHPTHELMPEEYRLSQEVVIFLIENQDHFLIGMHGTAADPETVRDVQSGATTPAPAPPVPTPTSTPTSTTPAGTPTRAKDGLARSSSHGSAGGESVRRFGGLRRNVSVSSHHSRQSGLAPSPTSPAHGRSMSGSGVQRSNTLPAQRSPALTPHHFAKPSHAATPPTPERAPSPSPPPSPSPAPAVGRDAPTAADASQATTAYGGDLASPGPVIADLGSRESLAFEPAGTAATAGAARASSPSATPARERNFSSLFSRSPTSDGERRDSRDGRGPNKLRKKRKPDPAHAGVHGQHESAQSSTQSLTET